MTGISGLSAYYSFPGGGSYGGSYGIAAAVRNAQNMGQISPIGYGAKKAASPDTPVEQDGAHLLNRRVRGSAVPHRPHRAQLEPERSG